MQVKSLQPAVQFGAWSQPGAMVSLQQKSDGLETLLESKLEAPLSTPVDPLAAFPAEQRTAIGKLKGFLQTPPAQPVGIPKTASLSDIRDILMTLDQSGYALTGDEQVMLTRQMGQQERALREHVAYFPKSGYYHYDSQACTPAQLTALLKAWAVSVNTHSSLLQMAKAIEASPNFVGDGEVFNAFQARMDELSTRMLDPVARHQYLKANLRDWQPKSQSDLHIDLMLNDLVPNLVGEGAMATAIRQQAKGMVGERNMKIAYAGRTPAGQLYVITESTQRNGETRAFIGAPGDLQPRKVTQGVRAMDGSDTTFVLEGNIVLNILRGGLGDGEDMRRWKATLNDEMVAKEFNPSTLPVWNPLTGN